MKAFILFILLAFLIINCQKEPVVLESSPQELSLRTDKFSYQKTDSILLVLDNKSNFDIELGFRCVYQFLEMFYQRKENDEWSENLWFGYMALRCPSIVKSIPSNSTFLHSVPAAFFDSTGYYRFLVPYSIPKEDSSRVLISNTFEVK